MAGSLTASVQEHQAEASEVSRWLISFARFVPFPSSPSPYPGLVPLGKSELSSSSRDGTWLSTVNLRLVDEVNRSDAILSVELSGNILEEHCIAKLNFSWWPFMSSVSESPPRGSRVILVSHMDSANEIQKFALRFSTRDAAVTFVAALKEKFKGLEEAWLQERETSSEASFQSDYNPGNETIPRATVEEPNMVKHLGSYVPEMQPMLEYQDGQILYPPQSTLSQIPNEPFSSLPPSSTTLLSGCFPNSTLDAGQTTVKQDPGLKSQTLEKLKGLEEVGIQERETKFETSFQSDYNPGNEIIPRAIEEEPNMFKPLDSYVPEMQPRPEYQTGQIIHPRQFTTVEEPNMVKHLDSCVPEMQPRLENEELPEGSDELLATKKRARENQLEEARRLASLRRKRKPEGIDYDPAIRFQKSALADEDRPALPITTEGIEAQLDVGRNKISQRQDVPAAMLQANMLNDPDSTCKRPKLMLPSDNELEGISKMGYATDLLAQNEELPEGSAALLAKNSQTPSQGTVAGKGDAIVIEAENLARLTDSQTPLLGGENPELHLLHFSAVTQGKEEIQTPDQVLYPSTTPGAAAALTPRTGLTPSRDEIHLNDEDMDMGESEELMIGEKTEAEAEEDNAGKTLVTLKLLCYFNRVNKSFHEKVDNIISNEKRVSIEVERRRFEHDEDYMIITISALEVFVEVNSPTLEAARKLFNCCSHVLGKPHLQRLMVGESTIRLLADGLVSFETSDIVFLPSEGSYQMAHCCSADRMIWTNVRQERRNKFECFTVEIWGSLKEVKRAFEETIVELRRNFFISSLN